MLLCYHVLLPSTQNVTILATLGASMSRAGVFTINLVHIRISNFGRQDEVHAPKLVSRTVAATSVGSLVTSICFLSDPLLVV